MTTQPEALRSKLATEFYLRLIISEQDAMMRRLHEVNQELLKTMKWLDNWMGEKSLLECANKVRDAIAKATGETK